MSLVKIICCFLIFNLFAEEYFVIKPEHSRIDFEVSYLKFNKVKGFFKNYKGKFIGLYDDESIRLKDLQISLSVASIDTRNNLRDSHLKKADFLDEKKYPFIYIRIPGPLKFDKDETKKVEAQLTIKNKIENIEVLVTYNGQILDPWKNENFLFDFETKINRQFFNLNWNYLTEQGVLVGNEIEISGQIQSQRSKNQTEWSKHYIPVGTTKLKPDDTKNLKPLKITETKKQHDPPKIKGPIKQEKSIPWISFFILVSFAFVGSAGGGLLLKLKSEERFKSYSGVIDLITILIVLIYSYSVYNLYYALT